MKMFYPVLAVMILIWSLFLTPFKVSAFNSQDPVPQPYYLIIHQIRGQECCGLGTVENLKKELDILQKTQLSAYFAFRYDALKDPEFIKAFRVAQAAHPQRFKPALLLEITPQLASASGVIYKGDPENWHRASQAYTLGYSPSDRRKLIDMVVSTYRKTFGTNLELTSSWMIDAESLTYLHDKYGVEIHQTTREQWGLDSYTLAGGQFHYPYPASRSWAFMPDYTATDTVMIVRQTVMDPLWVYGDTTSAFTSQPNDYLLDGKTGEYFQKLLGQQGSFSRQPRFMVLGLENTMPDNVHEEYQRQIEWLSGEVKKTHTIFPTPQGLRWVYGRPQVRVVNGEDLTGKISDTQSWWVTTPTYRLRLLRQGTQIAITDIRIYSSELHDPYSMTNAQGDGYWVAPFVLDSSLTPAQSDRRWWQWWRPPDLNLVTLQPKSDVGRVGEGWKLPLIKAGSSITLEESSVAQTLAYMGENGQSVKLEFKPEKWNVEGVSLAEIVSTYPLSLAPTAITLTHEDRQAQLSWKVGDQEAWGVSLNEIASNSVEFTPHIDASHWSAAMEQNRQYFFPEPELVDDVRSDKTILYINNQHTVAGRTPIRIVVAPKGEQGLSVGLNKAVKVETSDDQAVISDTEKIKDQTLQFIDVARTPPGKTEVKIKIGNTYEKKLNLYFAPDCRAALPYCLQHPVEAWWFARSWVGDKVRSWSE